MAGYLASMMDRPLLDFPINFEPVRRGKHFHMIVKVWASFEAMHKATEMPKSTQACCITEPYTEGGPERLVCTVHFVAGNYGIGVVVHELQHAIHHWVGMAGLDWEKDEEKICWEMGHLATQFYQHYYIAKENNINV